MVELVMSRKILLFVVNEAYFFISHRLELARRAQAIGYAVHVAAPADHVWAPADFSVERLKEEGFVFHPLPISRRGQNPFAEVKTLISIYRLFRRLKPDLVHLLTIKPILYGGLAARLAGVPSVVAAITGLGQIDVATGFFASLRRALVTRIMKISLGHRNLRVVLQNEEDQEMLVRNNIVDRSRTNVIGGVGVDLDLYQYAPEPSGDPLVILPARLIWEKGVAEFVEMARNIRQKGVSARFALVGDIQPSNPRSIPATTLDAWQKEGVIEVWGRKTDMAEVYSRCHVVCLPTIYGEGVPKVLLEAAASGRPVVTTDVGGCKAAVVNGETGFIVPKNNVAALTTSIQELLEQPKLRESFGNAARIRAEKLFDVRRATDAAIGIYDLLLPAER
jgi:glycosyltransferase involved in cell wall biosynthesis